MTLKVKILSIIAVICNVGLFVLGWVVWQSAWNLGQYASVFFLIGAGVLNVYLLAHEFFSVERRLERQVKLARLRKELKEFEAG